MSLARRAVLPVLGLAGAARRWPVVSHQRAQHNAMLASTEAARRRVERHEVEHYLEELAVARGHERPHPPLQPRAHHV
ncbi:hypothetical protein ABKW28_03505 [Nocardioides sp. 31GB23]|uniref:hypothetical protein n=1 Tax=Nocardioides sp. 31GB23 TaxID=3156065 RepID=UPI0032AFEC96